MYVCFYVYICTYVGPETSGLAEAKEVAGCSDACAYFMYVCIYVCACDAGVIYRHGKNACLYTHVEIHAKKRTWPVEIFSEVSWHIFFCTVCSVHTEQCAY